MTRRDRLAAWWRTARSTWLLATWESRVWTAVAVAGMFVRGLRESVPVLFFLSTYALVKGSRAEAQGAKLEMRQEEAEATG